MGEGTWGDYIISYGKLVSIPGKSDSIDIIFWWLRRLRSYPVVNPQTSEMDH